MVWWLGGFVGKKEDSFFKAGRNNNSMFIILMGVISRELKINDTEKRAYIARIIFSSGQDEIIFRWKHDNCRDKADVWAWILVGG